MLSFGWTSTIAAGEYLVAIKSSTGITTTNANGTNVSLSQYLGEVPVASAWSGILGVASASNNQRLPGLGIYSSGAASSTASIPNSISIAQIVGTTTTQQRPFIFYLTSGALN
jgi:hypothetical protein